jgi:serine/threonine-protein kinase PRP4
MVSRFYRPPEIILGLGVSHAADVWSLGCSLLEMWTGRVVFPGKDNHDMLRLQMECRSKVPHKIIRRAPRGSIHFDTARWV